ncbi:hypothetical protein BY996DRAFT_6516343 [Phakopsora pachyrhizi]|nr:hypothetical protein BY996DRAFT_6516343 [Phakopsora pachyrhizi]
MSLMIGGLEGIVPLLLIEDSLIEDLSSLNQLDGLIKNQINRTDKRTEDFCREISDLNNKAEMLRELGPASFDEEAKGQGISEVQQTAQESNRHLRLKSDERIKPRKEQQEQQLEWNNLDKKGFKRQEKHKLVKDWPSLELRECYKVVGVMDGHRKVLCTAGQIVSLEANNIQEGDISTAKIQYVCWPVEWSENLPSDGSNPFRDEDDLLDDKTDRKVKRENWPTCVVVCGLIELNSRCWWMEFEGDLRYLKLSTEGMEYEQRWKDMEPRHRLELCAVQVMGAGAQAQY